MPVLLVVEGPTAGVRYVFDTDAEAGRSSACRIRIVDERVSRRHALFSVEGGSVTVADLGSRNGTWVDGERIATPVRLSAGDRVRVGGTLLVFEPALDLVPARFTGGVLVIDDAAVKVEEVLPETATPAPAGAGLLVELAAGLAGASSEAEILVSAIDALGAGLMADAACVVIAGTGGRFGVPAALAGSREIVMSRAVLGSVLEEGRRLSAIVRVTDADDEDARRSVLAVPIHGTGGIIGMLHLERRLSGTWPRPWDETDLARLAAAGGIVGLALSHVGPGAAAEVLVPELVGESRSFRAVRRAVDAAAATLDPILLDGERGTGRSLLASAVHAASSRSAGPFVVFRAGALSEADIAAGLFGRETSGSATSDRVHTGALEAADGGTLYLEDLDAVPASLQARLARTFDEAALTRESGRQAVPVDVRLVASRTRAPTGRPGEVSRRLGRTAIHLPPLREREGDVPLLFEHLAREAGRTIGRAPLELGPAGAAAAEGYPWPGNVTELRLVVERLARIQPPGATVGPADLPGGTPAGALGDAEASLADRVAALEAAEITRVLREERGRKVRAAKRLGISRPTLDRKLALYGIDPSRSSG